MTILLYFYISINFDYLFYFVLFSFFRFFFFFFLIFNGIIIKKIIDNILIITFISSMLTFKKLAFLKLFDKASKRGAIALHGLI